MRGLLHRTPPFTEASARIVDDLVDSASAVTVGTSDTQWTAGAGLFLVEQGPVAVTLAQVPRAGEPASLHRRWTTVLRPGTVLDPRLMSDPRCDGHVVAARAVVGPAQVRHIGAAALRGALRVAPALVRSLDPDRAPRPIFAWVTGRSAPHAALADVLAATVVRGGGRAVVAAWAGGAPTVRLWTPDGPRALTASRARTWADWSGLLARAGLLDGPRAPWVFLVGEGDSPPVDGVRLQRILWTCDGLPGHLPAVAQHLPPDACDAAGWPLHGTLVPLVSRGATQAQFASVPLLATDRMARDAVRWPVDRAALARASRRGGDWVRVWRRHDPTGAAGAAAVVRALRHRRVGVAVSGGGAGAYRAVPALRQILAGGVPVDVVAGSSGGAVLGAYFAAGGQRGLDRFVADAWPLQRAFIAAVADGRSIEGLIDRRFDGVRVGATPARFVAATTFCPPHGPPRAHRVESGSLGQAVRASTALPPIIAPYDRGPVRYLDGAAVAQLPAGVLSRVGADLTVAIDALTAPSGRNPLGTGAAADSAYHGLTGRVVDAYTWFGVLGQRATAAEGAPASVYIQPSPTRLPLAIVGLFAYARRIVSEAERDPAIRDGAARVVARWSGWGAD
ncbi:MAG: putative acylesterase/phospholipase RssA [Myxococcota bacterium]|jgi:predicted acylesterase/phospholipase RssA